MAVVWWFVVEGVERVLCRLFFFFKVVVVEEMLVVEARICCDLAANWRLREEAALVTGGGCSGEEGEWRLGSVVSEWRYGSKAVDGR